MSVECPACGGLVACVWKCEHCDKPRPFGGDDDGAEDRRQGAGNVE